MSKEAENNKTKVLFVCVHNTASETLRGGCGGPAIQIAPSSAATPLSFHTLGPLPQPAF
jgi:hypothetical protein